MQNQKQFSFGLRPTKSDKRDFKFEKVFGSVRAEVLPDDFMVAEPLEIKDQNGYDFCAGFSATSVKEDQERILLDPYWLFAKCKQIEGNYQSYGTDLRTACKAIVKYGALPKEYAPFHGQEDRNFLANWENYPSGLDEYAIMQKGSSYFYVAGNFDAMRSALWLNRIYKRSILTGLMWCWEWFDESKKGVIDEVGSPYELHAVKFYGWKMINNKPYMICQNSWGKDIGNNGIFYLSPQVINASCKWGGYLFIDMTPEEAKQLSWNIYQRILDKIKKVLLSMLEILKTKQTI